jgi:hypothetical protein
VAHEKRTKTPQLSVTVHEPINKTCR